MDAQGYGQLFDAGLKKLLGGLVLLVLVIFVLGFGFGLSCGRGDRSSVPTTYQPAK